MEEITTTATAAEAANETSQASVAEQAPAAEPALQPANVFGFAPESGDPVGAEEELGEATPAEEPAEEQEDGQAPGDELNGKPQKTIGAYWRKERERRDQEIARAKQEYEQKLNGDPIRQIGQLMVDNIVAREGKTPEEAAKIAEDRFVAAYAKQEGLTPAQARLDLTAKRLLTKDAPTQKPEAPAKPEKPGKPAEQRPEDLEAEAEARAIETIEALTQMKLPRGFDLDAAMQDQSFLDLLLDYDPKAAVRIYDAETRARQAPQQIADRLRARQQIPQSTRPQRAIAPEPSYRDMSSEDFFAEKERLLKQMNR